jgi:hypothetical protein
MVNVRHIRLGDLSLEEEYFCFNTEAPAAQKRDIYLYEFRPIHSDDIRLD